MISLLPHIVKGDNWMDPCYLAKHPSRRALKGGGRFFNPAITPKNPALSRHHAKKNRLSRHHAKKIISPAKGFKINVYANNKGIFMNKLFTFGSNKRKEM